MKKDCNLTVRQVYERLLNRGLTKITRRAYLDKYSKGENESVFSIYANPNRRELCITVTPYKNGSREFDNVIHNPNIASKIKIDNVGTELFKKHTPKNCKISDTFLENLEI